MQSYQQPTQSINCYAYNKFCRNSYENLPMGLEQVAVCARFRAVCLRCLQL